MPNGIWLCVTLATLIPFSADARRVKASKEVKEYCKALAGKKARLKIDVATILTEGRLHAATTVRPSGTVAYKPSYKEIAGFSDTASTIKGFADIVKQRRPMDVKVRDLLTFATRSPVALDVKLLVIPEGEEVIVKKVSLPHEGEYKKHYSPDLALLLEGQLSTFLDVGLDRLFIGLVTVKCDGVKGSSYSIEAIERCWESVFAEIDEGRSAK